MKQTFSRSGKNPHIVFVYPPGSSAPDETRRAHFKMCLGSAYIMAYLAPYGWVTRQLETREPVNASECARRIKAMNPKIAGFTVDNTNYFFCLFIAKILEEIAPEIIILFGGFMPTIHAQPILEKNPFVDICARGESEETCHDLLTRLEDAGYNLNKTALHEVKGISFRRDGQIISAPDRNVILANLHVPDFLDTYPSPYLSGIASSSRLGIITARGCNQNCVYCFCPIMSRRKIATHSVDRVIAELDFIARNLVPENPPVIDIFDDTFTLIPGRAMEICRKIIENKIKLPLSCITRCDKVDEALLDAMRAAGVKSIELSLESAVPHLLRKIGKVQSPDTTGDDDFQKEKEFIEKFKKYIVYSRKIGIENVFTSIMIGIPGETPEEARQTIDLVSSFSESIDFYGHNIFKVHPGTPLFSYYEKYGYRLEQHHSKVYYETMLTYDTSQIPVAPKSHFEILGTQRDMDNTHSLALVMSSNRQANFTAETIPRYFNKMVLRADVISEELVFWTQKYLALNGSFIHIYGSLDQANALYRANEKRLKDLASPTQYLEAYYLAKNENGITTLMPYRTWLLNRRCGFPIYLADTEAGILNRGVNPIQSVCVDRADYKEDVLRLRQLLADIAKEESAISVLFNHPTYPYFSSLCRWERGLPNCRVLETVFVDSASRVKTCWNGEPIGTVGMPFEEMAANLAVLHEKARDRRGCKDCQKQEACARCLFPAPLTEQEYCHFKTETDLEEAAEMIRTFDGFKLVNIGVAIQHHGA